MPDKPVRVRRHVRRGSHGPIRPKEIEELVHRIAPGKEPEVCYREEGGFFIYTDPPGKGGKVDKEKFKPAPEVFKMLAEGLRANNLNIVDFSSNPPEKQMEVLSQLAGKRVYGWQLIPSIIHHRGHTSKERCPQFPKE